MVNYLPHSLKEALELRATEQVVPYAGGTDLMIDAHQDVKYLFLHKVPEMLQIAEDDTYIRIGAACTYTDIANHPLCPGILRDAILEIAAPAIRNLGTLGGNIGNGSAKADSALIFFVADAGLRIASAKGERIVPIRSFYLGRKKLDLQQDELIVEVLFPKNRVGNYYYKKIGARGALAISRVAFAGLLDIQDGVIAHCATAFGAVSDVIICRSDIDQMLVGKTLKEAKEIKDDYLKAFEEAIVPIRGRVSEEYRKDVCMNLLVDFLNTNGI